MWHFNLSNSTGAISTTVGDFCIDIKNLKDKPLAMAKCEPESESQRFSYVEKDQHFQSALKAPCRAAKHQGKMCYLCLDTGTGTIGVNLWDCKTSIATVAYLKE